MLVVFCASRTGKIIFLEHLGLQLESSSSDKAFPSIVWFWYSPPRNLGFWEGDGIGAGGYVPRAQGSKGSRGHPGGGSLGLAALLGTVEFAQPLRGILEVWGLLPFLVGCRSSD